MNDAKIRSKILKKVPRLNRGDSSKKNVIFSSRTCNIHKVVLELVSFIVDAANLEEDGFPFVICEAVENAVIHGNKKDPRKKVFTEVAVTQRKVLLKVADQGSGFDYNKLSDPRDNENLQKRHGRGLFIIFQLMDEVRFNSVGNEIKMVKYLDRKYLKSNKGDL